MLQSSKPQTVVVQEEKKLISSVIILASGAMNVDLNSLLAHVLDAISDISEDKQKPELQMTVEESERILRLHSERTVYICT